MKHLDSGLKEEVQLLSKVNQRLTLSFGVLILFLMISVLIVSGVYLKGVMDREEQKLSTLFTQVLATSVSRVSFSGRYHSQLLLEDTQKGYSDIRSLLITDLQGVVLASSIKEKNDTTLEGESRKAAENVLAQNIASQTRLTTFDGEPVIEITLPYRGGFNHSVQGVVQVKLSTLIKDQEINRGIILITVMVALLLVIGILIVRKISLYFGGPIQHLANDMAATLNAIPDLLFELDLEGRYIQVMANKEELLSDTRERLLGRTVNEVLSEDAAAEIIAALDEANESGESHGRQISLTISGEVLWFELSVARKKSEMINDPSFIVLSRDITERKKAEQELYEYREHLEELVQERTFSMKAACDEAERANTAKSEFLSRMSHELRTPMNAILGFGQMLEMDIDEKHETQRSNIKEILSAGYHLLDLINEVLDLARIESGKLEILMETIPIDQVSSQCISLIQPQADQQSVSLINNISGQNCIINADIIRFKQILLNLLSNAVKYNHKGGSVTLDCMLINKQRLRISVTSTGVCLTEAEIDKIFKPFERLDVENKIEGTGIGLAISKHLVESMGGVIGVESDASKGNTFWLEFIIIDDS